MSCLGNYSTILLLGTTPWGGGWTQIMHQFKAVTFAKLSLIDDTYFVNATLWLIKVDCRMHLEN